MARERLERILRVEHYSSGRHDPGCDKNENEIRPSHFRETRSILSSMRLTLPAVSCRFSPNHHRALQIRQSSSTSRALTIPSAE
jgi:hypothetical protein